MIPTRTEVPVPSLGVDDRELVKEGRQITIRELPFRALF